MRSSRMLAVAVMAAAVLVLGGACRSFAPPLAQGNVEAHVVEATAPAPRLGPGDRLSVVVFDHPETSTPAAGLVLDPEGNLDLPLVGPVRLAGMTIEEARARLTTEFARYLREPRVSLNLVESRGRSVWVLGEVDRPGPYPIERPLTALQALSLAGGFRAGADRHQIALLRGSQDALQVHFFDGATPGPDGLVSILPDDMLFVRLSGAGTFRDQILPIVQSIVPPITGFASLVIAADRLKN